MFCQSCGERIDDGAKFCMKCGTAVNSAFPQTAPITPTPVQETNATSVSDEAGNNPKSTSLISFIGNALSIIVTALVAFGLVLFLVLSGNFPKGIWGTIFPFLLGGAVFALVEWIKEKIIKKIIKENQK